MIKAIREIFSLPTRVKLLEDALLYQIDKNMKLKQAISSLSTTDVYLSMQTGSDIKTDYISKVIREL